MPRSHHETPTVPSIPRCGDAVGSPATAWGTIDGMDMEVAARILDQVAAVPRGYVATYGDLAARAGSRSARLAGRVLAELSDDSVPWHRIVRADGRPVDHLRAEQTELLRAEGVQVQDGRVDLGRHRWRPPAGP